jgi:glutamate dehydrogenase (NADP+)
MLSRTVSSSFAGLFGSRFASFSAIGEKLYAVAQKRDPDQPEFLQAVEEVIKSLEPVFKSDAHYATLFERLLEPERLIQFRVPWVDDKGVERVNRGFRVQYNSAIGPYKGGVRLASHVNLSVIKFLGFEQIFKNSLTTLPMGGGKGGSDFDPHGKSDIEVMRFCQSFMTELYRHIGPNTDVPAGDIGVGKREVGYLFGQYKRIVNAFEGVLTGKALEFGGSLIRTEATGYGAVYFAAELLKTVGKGLKGLKVAVSGAGNVAQYAVEKLLDEGAIPVTMGDTSGHIYEPEGITREQLAEIMHIGNVDRKKLDSFKGLSKKGVFTPGLDTRVWSRKCDLAMPCATQNEILKEHAIMLRDNGCFAVVEGANMPSTNEAVEVYYEAGMLYGLGKAANAGGVAVSGLEMSQNSMRYSWSRAEVDEKLRAIMHTIHKNAHDTAAKWGFPGNLQIGANIAAFLKVAHAMDVQGTV